MNKPLIAVMVSLILSTPVLADQCQWLTPEQAAAAEAILKETTDVAGLCEPCGDVEPMYETVKSVERMPIDSETSSFFGPAEEIAVNGLVRDAAYLYFKPAREGASYQNLAMAIGCEVSDVSPTLPAPVLKAPIAE